METIKALREAMEKEPDVARVIELAKIENQNLYHYFIETPFGFPKFVIGTTDPTRTHIKILYSCGEEWNARNHWNSLHPG